MKHFLVDLQQKVVYNVDEVKTMLRLKELRINKKMSQSDVASILQITQQAYANYERGTRQADYNTLAKLSEIFGVSIDYLLGNSENPKSLDEQLEGIDFALFGEVQEMTDEQKQDVLDYIQYKKSKNK